MQDRTAMVARRLNRKGVDRALKIVQQRLHGWTERSVPRAFVAGELPGVQGIVNCLIHGMAWRITGVAESPYPVTLPEWNAGMIDVDKLLVHIDDEIRAAERAMHHLRRIRETLERGV
jgi:hypothetical protein